MNYTERRSYGFGGKTKQIVLEINEQVVKGKRYNSPQNMACDDIELQEDKIGKKEIQSPG